MRFTSRPTSMPSCAPSARAALGIEGGSKQLHEECCFYAEQGDKEAVAVLTALDEMVPETKTHKEAGAMDGRGEKATGNTSSFTQDGVTRTYALSRLKRDRPDLAERVIAGEISANA